MALTLTATQDCVLTIKPTDKKGNPAPVDGVPTWFSNNTDVLTVTASADGLSAVISAVGALGAASINVDADADLGSGVVDIAGILDVTVVAGSATVVVITPDVPTEQP